MPTCNAQGTGFKKTCSTLQSHATFPGSSTTNYVPTAQGSHCTGLSLGQGSFSTGFESASFRSLSLKSTNPRDLFNNNGHSLQRCCSTADVSLRKPEQFSKNMLGVISQSKPKIPIQDSIKPLLWNFSDYSVSPCHGFSASNAGFLISKIENALRQSDICYEVDSSDSLSYDCEKTVDCTLYRFSITVSSLLRRCQESLRCKYLVEVSRTRSGNIQPSKWNEIVEQLFKRMGKAVFTQIAFDPWRKETPKCDIFNTDSNDEAQVNTFNIVHSFIDVFEAASVTEKNVSLVELYAQLSCSRPQLVGEQVLREGDASKLAKFLQVQNTSLIRCTCIILRNICDAGSLKDCDSEELKKLFRELARLSQDYSDTLGLEAKLEAVKALNSIGKVYTPNSHDRDFLVLSLSTRD